MIYMTHMYKLGLNQFPLKGYMIAELHCSIAISENPDGAGDWTVEDVSVYCQAEGPTGDPDTDTLLLPLTDTNPLYEPVLLDFLTRRRAEVDELWRTRKAYPQVVAA